MRRRKTLGGSARVVAMNVLLVPLLAGPVLAQTAPPAPEVAQQAQRSFNIPPQALSTALPVFGRQSGRQVSANADAIQNVQTPGVRGTMTSEEALRRLLAGTSLTYSSGADGTLTVHRLDQPSGTGGTTQLDPVQVQGMFLVPPQAMIDNLPPPYAGGQVATGGQLGLLGNRPVMDTPFNQTNYTAKKAQDQQAKTVRDVLIDDPSVRSFMPDGAWSLDFVRIRGFQVSNWSTTYGGLFGMTPSYSIMAELAERIEVLKGPSAMLNGMPPINSIGGTINIVPKRAPEEGITQLTANYASTGQFGGHADLGRRFGSDKQFGVRFNGVFKAGQTAVENNSDQRGLALLGLDFRGERVRLAADLGYQYQYIGGLIPVIGLDANVPLPWAPNIRKNFGEPWGFAERKDLFGVVRAEVDLTERITAYAAFGAHDFRNMILSSQYLPVSSFFGNSTATPLVESSYQTYLTAQAGLRGFADTGPINHEFALSSSTLRWELGTADVEGASYLTNIYSPTVIQRPNIATPAANKTSVQNLSSWAIADTLSAVHKRIQLTVGARLQQVTATNFNTATGIQTTSYDETAVSPSVALVFKPWQNVSVYGNFIQGLQQGAIVPGNFANAGEVFPPFKSTQYEAGLKIDWGKLTTTASAFQISQPSVLTNVANNTQFLGGEQRNQGLELNFFGEVTEGIRILGGVMFLSAVLAKTQGGLTDGWIAPFSPGTQFNLGGELDLPFVPGLTLTGRILYTGSQYIDTTWPRRSLPEWTRLDVGARYAFENPGAKNKLLVARFSVENLLDANYWAGGGAATTLMLGAPRTFRLALSADF